jgi:5'-deoxynucleotidase YfbR-like HD superfamily hydrolase
MTESEILEELNKIVYNCYGLNKVIRYGKTRNEEIITQSVAEHVANMLYLAHYFKDKIEFAKDLDFEKVTEIILMHDMGEIETGDIICTSKTQDDTEVELQALEIVKEKSPDFVKNNVVKVFNEFKNISSPEAVYVKVIDRFEGYLYWFSDAGIKMIKTVHPPDKIVEIENAYVKGRLEFFEKNNFQLMADYAKVIFEDQKKRGIFIQN